MATIALYSNKINQTSGLLEGTKKSVGSFKSELLSFKSKTMAINKNICKLDDVISTIQTSTIIQEEKVDSLEQVRVNIEQFVAACELSKGDEIINASGGSYPVEQVEFEEKQETVYNFQVEDYHTYYVGESSVLVHNDCSYKISDNGDIEVTDWKDYPDGQPKPEGSLKLVDGDDYVKVRNEANNANRNIHKSDPSLMGKDIHEIKPVKWGGSPTDLSNKIPLTRSEHVKLTGWWKTFQSMVEKNK